MLTLKEIQELGIKIIMDKEETAFVNADHNACWTSIEVFLTIYYNDSFKRSIPLPSDGFISINGDGLIRDVDTYTFKTIQKVVEKWLPTISQQLKLRYDLINKEQVKEK